MTSLARESTFSAPSAKYCIRSRRRQNGKEWSSPWRRRRTSQSGLGNACKSSRSGRLAVASSSRIASTSRTSMAAISRATSSASPSGQASSSRI
eukprot:6569489-Prymnesium_polylepis.2